MSGFFGVLRDSSDSSEEEEAAPNNNSSNQIAMQQAPDSTVHIPSYEDLSSARADEETVLNVVYEHDFRKYAGVWGCPRFEIDIRPPDIEKERIGSELWCVLVENSSVGCQQ